MSEVTIALWAAAGLWAAAVAVYTLAPWFIPRLPAAFDEDSQRPPVSIVVCARNEEARIENTVRRLLSQIGPLDQVVVVDDRSEDRTGSIVAGVAGSDPRVLLLRIDALPEGWLGKTHACHVGASQAVGEWLLFTDGDAWLGAHVVDRALRSAIQGQADHLCVIPLESRSTTLSNAGMLACYVAFTPAAALANLDLWRRPIGIGAFNLVRRAAYHHVGGHRALRLEVIEDAALGGLLLAAGFRTRVYQSPGDLEVDWSGTLRGIVFALEKNAFAAMGYRTGLSLLTGLALLGLWTASILGPLSGSTAGFAAAAGLWAMVLPGLLTARRLGLAGGPALLVPLTLPVIPLAIVYSTWVTLRRGGVKWRGTFYPLELLRSNSTLRGTRNDDR